MKKTLKQVIEMTKSEFVKFLESEIELAFSLFQTLTKKEQELFNMIFTKNLTIQQVAKHFNITQARAEYIEKGIIDKLKFHPILERFFKKL